MILGKRDRPTTETQATNKLTKVFENIKTKYSEALNLIQEETKDDPVKIAQNWCGYVIKLCATEFPRSAQRHLLETIRTVLDVEKSMTQPQE